MENFDRHASLRGMLEHMDDDIDRRCPECEAVMLPRALSSGKFIDRCPACGLVVV